MLFYTLRMLLPLLRGRLRPEARICRTTHHVRLAHVDYNRHMNQAVYLNIGEAERLQWLLRTRILSDWRAAGVHPVVAEQRIVYRRELAPFQRYQVDTRAVAIEGRLLKLEQYFLVGDRVHTYLDAKLIFIGLNGVLSPAETTTACQPLIVDALPVEQWTVLAANR